MATSEKPLPPDRLQKQIVGLTDRVFVCASQSAAAVNNIALLSSAMVSLSADREAYGIFRARKRAHGTSS